MVHKAQAVGVSIFLFLILAVIFVAPGAALVQSPVDDVHVSPRVQPPPAEKEASIPLYEPTPSRSRWT